VEVCPQKALVLVTEFIDLEDKTVAAISEEHRKKIRYTCGTCKPETGQTPCVLACNWKAINCICNPKSLGKLRTQKRFSSAIRASVN